MKPTASQQRRPQDGRLRQLCFKTAKVLASPSPPHNQEERAGERRSFSPDRCVVGERGISMLSVTSACNNDGPPLPGPLLPQREEREMPSRLSSAVRSAASSVSRR